MGSLDSVNRIAEVSISLEVRHDIVLGVGCYAGIPDWLVRSGPIDKLLIVTDYRVDRLYGQDLAARLIEAGYDTSRYVLDTGRSQKTLATVEQILSCLFRMKAERSSVILTLGGGVVGDIGGLAAALYLRGIRYMHLPTTLLSQVDSSIGGKVGVNYGQHLNGIGRFYYPEAIWADPQVLATLPAEEFVSGLAEVVKYASILDAPLFEYLESHTDEVRGRDSAALLKIISHAIAMKARIVSADPREKGEFKLFTYGHEIGHALEVLLEYQDLRHGEAVAIGVEGAMWLSQQLGVLRNPDAAQRQSELLSAFGLPLRLPVQLPGVQGEGLVSALGGILQNDKQRANRRMVWVLPVDIGQGVCSDEVPPDLVFKCLLRTVGC